MTKLNTYLNFDGRTEEAFKFYKSVFGGEFSILQRYKEMPKDVPTPGPMSEAQKEKILHVSLPIGEDMLMGSDSPENMKVIYGNNFSVSVSLDSKEEAKRAFDALSSGGKVGMPIADAFWGQYFGMLTDKFGVNWMVSFEYPK